MTERLLTHAESVSFLPAIVNTRTANVEEHE